MAGGTVTTGSFCPPVPARLTTHNETANQPARARRENEKTRKRENQIDRLFINEWVLILNNKSTRLHVFLRFVFQKKHEQTRTWKKNKGYRVREMKVSTQYCRPAVLRSTTLRTYQV